MALGIGQEAVVDERVRVGIGRAQLQMAARARLEMRRRDQREPGQLARVVPADGNQVEVVRAGRTARADLAEGLLFGDEARGGRGADLDVERGVALEQERERGVVVQVLADARKLVARRDAEALQLLRVADARAQQDRRRLVRAGREHDAVGDDAHLLAVTPADDLDAIGMRLELQAERVVEHPEVVAAASPVDVRERGVEAHAVIDVDGLDAVADPAVEIVQVVDPRHAELGRRSEARLVKRPDLVLGVDAHAHALDRVREQRAEGVGAPPLLAGQRRPAVVVVGGADHGGAAVVRRAASHHAGALERQHLAAGIEIAAVVAPLMRRRERTAVEQISRPAAALASSVVGSRLDQHDVGVALRGDPTGYDTAGRAGSDNRDVTPQLLHQATIAPARAGRFTSARARMTTAGAPRLPAGPSAPGSRARGRLARPAFAAAHHRRARTIRSRGSVASRRGS